MNKVKIINIVFFVTVLLSIIGTLINQWVLGYTSNYFVVLLISQIILVLPSAIYLALSKTSIAKAIRFKKIKGSNVILLILFAYLISPLMTLINAISMLFVSNNTAELMGNMLGNNGFIISLLVIAFVPCVLEETVYRGIFYNEYRKVSPLKGILLSAFLFGIMHLNFNQFSYAFAMGIIFAFLIEATDSILSTMIVHFIINGTSVLIMHLYPKMMQLLEEVYGSSYFDSAQTLESVQESLPLNFSSIILTYGFPALIGIILAFFVYRAIAKNSGRWDFIKGLFKKDGNMKLTHWEDEDGAKMPFGYQEYNDNVDYYEYNQTGNDEYNYRNSEGNKTRLITISLLIGILICLTLMIIGEIWSKLPSQAIDEINKAMTIHLNHILF